MEPDVRKQLLQLTADFYRFHAASFDESRKGAWHSWEAVLADIQPFRTILDVGCGNGRFVAFLNNHIDNFMYTGIDAETSFIDLAQSRYPSHTFRPGHLTDFEGTFDAIVSFGVFHHVPGFEQRVELLRRLSLALNDNGRVALSLWQPELLENFDKKISSRPLLGLEKGDYLLGWNGNFDHVRYCHHFDDREIAELVDSTSLQVVRQFQGTSNDKTNRYLVLAKSRD
jgi:tRNA (uracil-5-)-methyltransferase TRM9